MRREDSGPQSETVDVPGSSVNGGELLLLALAPCCCSEIHRDAGKLGIAIELCGIESISRNIDSHPLFGGVLPENPTLEGYAHKP